MSAVSRACYTRSGDGTVGQPTRETLSVVVVDDDPLALKLVRSTLEPLGWECIRAPGGQDAADSCGGRRLGRR